MREQPHAVGLGTGLPRASPAGSVCSARGPEGCWHPGEPRAAPRRGAPRRHPAPRRLQRSLQEAKGQGAWRGRSPLPPGAVPGPTRRSKARRAPRARSPAPGRGIGKVRAAPSTGAGSSRSAPRLCCRDYWKFLGTQRPAPRLPPQRIPASGLPAPTPNPGQRLHHRRVPHLRPRPPAGQCCVFRGLAALNCSERTAERLPGAGGDGRGRGKLCPLEDPWRVPLSLYRAGAWKEAPAALYVGQEGRCWGRKGCSHITAGTRGSVPWAAPSPQLWLWRCSGRGDGATALLQYRLRGRTLPPSPYPQCSGALCPPPVGLHPQPCPGASPTAGRSWAVGSGTQHPSRLRSGPGTGRALTAKCFECSAAIRQRWLRPRFPSSSAPRGRRQVNTASGPTGTGTSRFPSPTGPENGPPGQPLPSPARRRPPTRGVPAPPNSSRPPPPTSRPNRRH